MWNKNRSKECNGYLFCMLLCKKTSTIPSSELLFFWEFGPLTTFMKLPVNLFRNTYFQAPSETSWTRIFGGRDQEHMFFTSFLSTWFLDIWMSRRFCWEGMCHPYLLALVWRWQCGLLHSLVHCPTSNMIWEPFHSSIIPLVKLSVILYSPFTVSGTKPSVADTKMKYIGLF